MATLDGVLPELALAFEGLRANLNARGIDVAIADYGGVRTLADTTRILEYRRNDYNAAVAAGALSPTVDIRAWRPIAPFGSSYHNYGAAFDLKIIKTPPGMSPASALAYAGGLAPAFGLRWGGGPDFPANRKDPPHFELAISLADARALYERFSSSSGLGLPDISQLIGMGPELTPTGGELPDYAGDDSGEAALELGIGPQPTPRLDALIIAGVVTAAALLYVIRRRLLGS